MVERLHAPVHQNASESLGQLLLAAKLIEPDKLNEALASAKRLDVPLDKALLMLKVSGLANLKQAVEANDMIMKAKIDMPLAIRALTLAKQNGIAFEDALNVMGSVISKTQNMPAMGNALVELLLSSEVLGPAQITQVMQQARDSNMSIGRTLIINRLVSRWVLQEVLTAQSLVKEEKIARRQAEQAIKAALDRRVGILQVLFEIGDYKDCSGETLKLSELVAMAGLLADGDFLDCLEISICDDKPFGQVMLEQNLITLSLLEAGCSLLDMVGSYIKPFQAAEAWKQVRARDVSVYQAIAELQPPPQVPQRQMHLGQLVAEAGLVPGDKMSASIQGNEDTPIKIGKRLMAAGLLTEAGLYKALRCQSLFKEGVLSADQAIFLMASCKDDAIGIEEALSKAGWNVPARMHWSWV